MFLYDCAASYYSIVRVCTREFGVGNNNGACVAYVCLSYAHHSLSAMYSQIRTKIFNLFIWKAAIWVFIERKSCNF